MSSVSSGNHESVMGMGTAGALHSILVQCSPSIFQVNLPYSVYTYMQCSPQRVKGRFTLST